MAQTTFFLSWNHFNKIDSSKTQNNKTFVRDEAPGGSTEYVSENTDNREGNPDFNSEIKLEYEIYIRNGLLLKKGFAGTVFLSRN